MIRPHDRVRVGDPGGMQGIVISLDDGVAKICNGANGKTVPILESELVLLCHRVTCHAHATRFQRNNLAAVCEQCAELRYHTHELVDTRGDVDAIVACACGESLDGATAGSFMWPGPVTCEYRTCMHCHSTRAYMPINRLAGRRVHLYRDPSTSEVSGEHDELLDALEEEPSDGAELIRNGVVLARVVIDPDGARAWLVAKPTREIPAKV